MTKILKNCLIATAMLLMAGAGFVACGDPFSRAGASEDPNQFTASIEGVVEKGPFVKGTTVTLYELNPETFAQTGRVFTGTVDRDNGSFALEKIELESPYVLVEANGYYWSELSGRKSNNSLKLKAVAHVEESSNININVGTHLTSSRILDLVDSGMDFDKAKVQAESELMKAFFGEESKTELEKASIFDNEKLLALSLIVLMSGSEADVTEALANISENFTDEAVLTKQADNSAMQYASYGKAREFMQEKFPDVQIGLFENQIESFWKRVYGIGECDKSKVGELDTIKAEKSAVDGHIVVCRDVDDAYLWFMATDLEISTAGYEPVDDGRLVISQAESTKAYVHDGDKWREATADELKLGESCTASRIGSIVETAKVDYVCKKSESSVLWQKASIRDFPKESYFNAGIKYGSVTDKRDGHVYKTVEIDGKTWMAENLVYVPAATECKDSLSIGCAYRWEDALGIAKGDSIKDFYQGICMDGWHIPDTTEWGVVLGSHRTVDLYSKIGWQTGKNATGFSIVPSLNPDYINYQKDAYYAMFVTMNNNLESVNKSDKYDSIFLTQYFVQFQDGRFVVERMSREWSDYSDDLAAVRCVKDSE